MTRSPAARAAALRGAVPGACTALVAAGAFFWLGRVGVATVLVVLSMGSLLLAAIAPRASSAIVRGLAAAGVRVGTFVVLVAAAIGGVLVIVPLWALNAVARLDPLDDGWRAPHSNWRRRPTVHRPDGAVDGAVRMGGVEHPIGPGKRGGRILRLGAVALVVVLVAGALIASKRLGDRSTAVEWGGIPVDSYAHEDEPWAPELFRELLDAPYRWDPFLGGRLGDFDGRYVTVHDGHRASYQPPDPELTVWYFGGSTMYGIGQRDDHTIPSEVARLAEADGISIRSENFGVSSWVNWQESLYLEELLQTREPPDLIVFYDGANELASAYQRQEAGDIDPDHNWRMTVNGEETRLRENSYPDNPPGYDPDLTVELAAAQYRRGVDRSQALADAKGVPMVTVWQPTLETKKTSAADRTAYERVGATPFRLGAQMNDQREQALEQSGVDAIDLTGALDGVDVPVYLDYGHTNELGARTVAEALYGQLRPQLERLAGS